MKRWILVPFILILTAIFSGCGNSSSTGKVDTGNTAKVENHDHKSMEASASPHTTNIQMSTPQAIPAQKVGIIPVSLEIPAIHVKAEVEKVGLLPDGKMGVPKGSETVAWYEPGTKPGAIGNAVIAGHVDDTVNPAVFYNLNKLKKGDQIFVTNQNGKELTFAVRDIEVYPRTDAPMEQIFGYTYGNMLNLITCEGKYDSKTTERAERLVVYTEVVTNN